MDVVTDTFFKKKDQLHDTSNLEFSGLIMNFFI